jgi:hypothetical protein
MCKRLLTRWALQRPPLWKIGSMQQTQKQASVGFLCGMWAYIWRGLLVGNVLRMGSLKKGEVWTVHFGPINHVAHAKTGPMPLIWKQALVWCFLNEFASRVCSFWKGEIWTRPFIGPSNTVAFLTLIHLNTSFSRILFWDVGISEPAWQLVECLLWPWTRASVGYFGMWAYLNQHGS